METHFDNPIPKRPPSTAAVFNDFPKSFARWTKVDASLTKVSFCPAGGAPKSPGVSGTVAAGASADGESVGAGAGGGAIVVFVAALLTRR